MDHTLETTYSFQECSYHDQIHSVCGADGERDKIPHPPNVPSGTHQSYSLLPFTLTRRQFLFDLCFVMTINNTQGQIITYLNQYSLTDNCT